MENKSWSCKSLTTIFLDIFTNTICCSPTLTPPTQSPHAQQPGRDIAETLTPCSGKRNLNSTLTLATWLARCPLLKNPCSCRLSGKKRLEPFCIEGGAPPGVSCHDHALMLFKRSFPPSVHCTCPTQFQNQHPVQNTSLCAVAEQHLQGLIARAEQSQVTRQASFAVWRLSQGP